MDPSMMLWDVMVYKLNSSGELQWQKTFAGTEYGMSGISAIKENEDGTFILAVMAQNWYWRGSLDLKPSETGESIWQKSLGGTTMIGFVQLILEITDN